MPSVKGCAVNTNQGMEYYYRSMGLFDAYKQSMRVALNTPATQQQNSGVKEKTRQK